MMTVRSVTSYCHGQNRLDLGKNIFLPPKIGLSSEKQKLKHLPPTTHPFSGSTSHSHAIELPYMTKDLWEVPGVPMGDQTRYPRISEVHWTPNFKHINYCTSVQFLTTPEAMLHSLVLTAEPCSVQQG